MKQCYCQRREMTHELREANCVSFMWGDLIGWSVMLSSPPSVQRQILLALDNTKEANQSNMCLGIVSGLNRDQAPSYLASDIIRRTKI
jgi:hypothetical protein